MEADAWILIVDDEEMVLTNLVAFFEDEGYRVEAADCGEEALKILKTKGQTHKPCGCIVDMRLPGMDGNEFILRANGLCPGLKYIIHTGSTEYQLPPALQEIGVSESDVLHKPLFDMSVVLDALFQKSS